MENTITVAELARQMQVLIDLGMADHSVIFFTPDEIAEHIERGVWDVWPDGTVALG